MNWFMRSCLTNRFAYACTTLGFFIIIRPVVAADSASDKWYSQQLTVMPAITTSENSQGSPDTNSNDQPKSHETFKTLPGFQIEKLFTAPNEELGTWVSMAVDDRGRLLVSDQASKGLCRITPASLDGTTPTRVEHLDIKVTAAQGMLFAFGNLYLSINADSKTFPSGSGLYRLRDTQGNDQFDELVKLKEFKGPMGEHGPHALRLSPDGKSIFVVCGNHTEVPVALTGVNAQSHEYSYLPTNWQEDILLPRIWDPSGHARGRMAPGGYIAQTDPQGTNWKFFSVGYRNCYDIAFNADGELFTSDSDMELDMGTPWYRPTRLVHATQGSEFGWRSGTGNWPWYYVDSLPPAFDIGPGSPTGMAFGYGARFPAEYQRALYVADWTFGTIYAMHLEPKGASYAVRKEEFLSRTPLPITNMAVGADGSLYFIVGGRGLQSELFRVRYIGRQPTDVVDVHDLREAATRELRHKIESFQVYAAENPKQAIAFLWPFLGHQDRFIRNSARVALEFQPVALWQDRVFSESDAETLMNGAVALAHQGDRLLQTQLLKALTAIDFQKLRQLQQLELLRCYQLAFLRMGHPNDDQRSAVLQRLDPFYPAENDLVNRELCSVLSYLQSPTVVAKTLPLLEQARSVQSTDDFGELLDRNRTYGQPIAAMQQHHPDEQKVHYAFALRVVNVGWTLEQHKAYFKFLGEARRWNGGQSYQEFLKIIAREALENCTESDRPLVGADTALQPIAIDLPKPIGPGHSWTLDELIDSTNKSLHGRSFENGQRTFAAARCIVCHRFGGDGGATGPDLSQLAGRFHAKDIAQKLIDPNKAIAGLYRATTVIANGKSYTGRIIADVDGKLIMVADPEDLTKTVEIDKAEVEMEKPSPISLMPKGLLEPLNKDEVLDLIAFLLSRGNKNDPMFTESQATH